MILEIWGMILMFLQGWILTAQLTAGKVLKSKQWPYFRMMSISCWVASFVVISGLVFLKPSNPTRHQYKWILLRGMFGAMANALLNLAVLFKTPLGDIAALTSINMVVAALFGRIFLHEKFGWIHMLAVLFSVVGVVLISKPSFLGGRADDEDLTWVGQVLSLMAGFSKGAVWISARKCSKVSHWILGLSFSVQMSVVFVTLPTVGLVNDFSWEPAMRAPVEATAWMALLFVVALLRPPLTSAGAKWCPAAISATLDTVSGMVGGYFVQLIFFNGSADILSFSGAFLMLLSVGIFAAARVPEPQKPARCENSNNINKNDASADVSSASELTSEADDNESLASFIASEFAEMDPHQQTVESSMRQRHAVIISHEQTLGCKTGPASGEHS